MKPSTVPVPAVYTGSPYMYHKRGIHTYTSSGILTSQGKIKDPELYEDEASLRGDRREEPWAESFRSGDMAQRPSSVVEQSGEIRSFTSDPIGLAGGSMSVV